MKIGLTLYGGLDEQSGGFRYDRQLVAGLREAGDSVECIELPWRAYHRGLLDNWSRELRRRLLDVDVDVMIQDELAHPSLVHTNRSLPYPIVSIVHHLRASEPRLLGPLYRAIERRYLATVDAAVCTSATTRGVVTDLGVAPARAVAAPPAGDRFDRELDAGVIDRRAQSDPLQVVFVGNITPRKGLDTLVRGVAKATADIDLTVIGRPVDTDHVAAVKHIVRNSGVADRVQFTGRLSDSELADRLESSHVLAVPSRYEGFGIVYLEGMCFGLPALATQAGGARDLISGDETGVLVEPNAPDAVARELSRFDADRERLAQMGRAARRRYEDHPSWDTTTARVRRLLTEVAETEKVSA